jgi:hypothetical protein
VKIPTFGGRYENTSLIVRTCQENKSASSIARESI